MDARERAIAIQGQSGTRGGGVGHPFTMDSRSHIINKQTQRNDDITTDGWGRQFSKSNVGALPDRGSTTLSKTWRKSSNPGLDWFERRVVRPSGTGEGRYISNDEEYFYPIQMVGPQSWSYQRGGSVNPHEETTRAAREWSPWEPTMESIMKDMRADAISYPERVNHGFYSKASTPGGMENYFLPRGDVVEVEKGIGPMWQRFLDRFRGPDGFEFGLPKYNSGGIAGLPGQWTPSMSESEEEEYNIRPLQLDPGIMSIQDLEDLFEEAGLDKSIIYKLINSGGLSQLIS